MFGYRVPAPDEAMLISGWCRKREGAPFRVVTGHGAFVMPIFEKAWFLTLAMQQAQLAEPCDTRHGITLRVCGVVAFKVGNDPGSIVNAGQRFLPDQRQMPVLAGRVVAGQLRSAIGSRTIEEVIAQRQELATEVFDGAKPEMARLGLSIDSFQLQSIDDMGAGYFAAMARRIQAEVQRQAETARERAGKQDSGP